MAIAQACAPAPVATPAKSTVTVPETAHAASRAPESTPIAAIAKILTQSGYAGAWDPSRLWLLSYEENDGVVNLVCGARDTEDVSEFLRRLASSSSFKNVTILGADSSEAGDLQARIRASVPPSGQLSITPATKSSVDFGKGNRDPFDVLATAPPLPTTTEIAGDSDLDQLKLVATIDGDSPRAMFMDPAEKGWTVKVGDHVGRADANAACSWQVADVKSSKVILERVDVAACKTKPPQRVFQILNPKHKP